MNKVTPSQRYAQELQELIAHGIKTAGSDFETEDLVGQLLVKALQRIVTETLEQEVTDFLGREHYQRRQGEQQGYRNGYRTGRLRTAEGAVPVEVPKARNTAQTFSSALWQLLKRRTAALEQLVVEAYARGLSTRDLEALFREDDGESLLSRTAVSHLTETLWEDYEAFAKRDLSGFKVVYLFLDAAYEQLRRQAGLKESLLTAWAILEDGSRVLINLALGHKESFDSWIVFLRDLMQRGLSIPLLVVSDGAPGLMRAIGEAFPHSLRGRCIVHKKRNVLARVPADARDEVRAWLNTVYLAPDWEAGCRAAEAFIARYRRRYPSAVKVFEDDLEASLAHLRCPAAHHKAIRTTNLIERSFGEQKRRTKVIPRFFDERSCLKLVFASLARASRSWRRVKMTELESQRIAELRAELGQPPPPPTDTTSKAA